MFLKNVYSVFQASPPSVGFAKLSEVALAMNGKDAPAPSATVGSFVASASETVDSGVRSSKTNDAGARGVGWSWVSVGAAVLVGSWVL